MRWMLRWRSMVMVAGGAIVKLLQHAGGLGRCESCQGSGRC